MAGSYYCGGELWNIRACLDVKFLFNKQNKVFLYRLHTKMAPNIDTLMCEVFSNVQFSKRLHQKYHKRLKSRYERVSQK